MEITLAKNGRKRIPKSSTKLQFKKGKKKEEYPGDTEKIYEAGRDNKGSSKNYVTRIS